MKTLYDWKPGNRGRVLAPVGSMSTQQTVLLGFSLGHDTFLELFESGRLRGEALADARIRYEFKEKAS